MADFSEADMYKPIKDYFVRRGYTVRAEVKNCDLAAEKDGELIVVEMKKGFQLKLVYQALDRLALTDQVYAAVPRPKKSGGTDYLNMLRLVKSLEIGLITVSMDSPAPCAEVVVYPETQKMRRKSEARKNSLLKELNSRSMDLNRGGSNKIKITTAYRERCIKIACILECRGAQTAKSLVGDYGCERDAGFILRRDVNGWFKRVSKGVYEISENGRDALDREQSALVEYYRGLYRVGRGKEDKNEV